MYILLSRDEDFQPRLTKKPDYETIAEENENWENLERSTYKGRSLNEARFLFNFDNNYHNFKFLKYFLIIYLNSFVRP